MYFSILLVLGEGEKNFSQGLYFLKECLTIRQIEGWVIHKAGKFFVHVIEFRELLSEWPAYELRWALLF